MIKRIIPPLKSFIFEPLEARALARLSSLQAPGGALDQVEALVGLGRALADGLAEELLKRLPFRSLYVPQPVAAPAWTPPPETPAATNRYQSMTVVALKAEARKRSLPVRPRVKKSELIAALVG